MIDEQLYKDARQVAITSYNQRMEGRIARIPPPSFREKPYIFEDGIKVWVKMLSLDPAQIAEFYGRSLMETTHQTFGKRYIGTWEDVYRSDLEWIGGDIIYNHLMPGKGPYDVSPLTDEEIYLLALRTVERYHELAMNRVSQRQRLKSL